jgi:hypothetical protein
MRKTVGIIALEVVFAKLPVGFPSVTASSAVGRAVAVLAGVRWRLWQTMTGSGMMMQPP